jgi:hypothetical protein
MSVYHDILQVNSSYSPNLDNLLKGRDGIRQNNNGFITGGHGQSVPFIVPDSCTDVEVSTYL